MAAYLLTSSMQDESFSPNRLRIMVGLLAQDIEAWVTLQAANKRWLDKYQYLLTQPQPLPPESTTTPLDASAMEPLASGLPWRVSLPPNTRRIVAAYQGHYDRLGFLGKVAAFFTRDAARHEQLRHLLELHTVLTQAYPGLKDISSDSLSSANLVALQAPALPLTHQSSLSPATGATQQTARRQQHRYLVNAMHDAISLTLKALPWYSTLLAPIRQLRTFWQTWTTTPRPSHPSPSLQSDTIVTPYTTEATDMGNTHSTSASAQQHPTNGSITPADTLSLTETPSPASSSSNLAPVEESPVSSSSSEITAPAYYADVESVLRKSLKQLNRYGNRKAYRNPTLESQLAQLCLQHKGEHGQPLSLDAIWERHIKHAYHHQRNVTTASAADGAPHWFGLTSSPRGQPDEQRHLLHYGRLKATLSNLFTALKAPHDEARIREAASALSLVLWEGVCLSHRGASPLWDIHHALIEQLMLRCQAHETHDALHELTATLSALTKDVVIHKASKSSDAWFGGSSTHYDIRPTSTPSDWRLLHDSDIQALYTQYINMRQHARAILRLVRPTVTRRHEQQALLALSESLGDSALWRMVFAQHDAEAQASRQTYHDILTNLGGWLVGLQGRHPDATRKAIVALHAQDKQLVFVLPPVTIIPSPNPAINDPIDTGFMVINTTIKPLIGAFFSQHPTHPLSAYSLDGVVPVEPYVELLTRLTRQQHRDSTAAQGTPESRALIDEYKRAKVNRRGRRAEARIREIEEASRRRSEEHEARMREREAEAEAQVQAIQAQAQARRQEHEAWMREHEARMQEIEARRQADIRARAEAEAQVQAIQAQAQARRQEHEARMQEIEARRQADIRARAEAEAQVQAIQAQAQADARARAEAERLNAEQAAEIARLEALLQANQQGAEPQAQTTLPQPQEGMRADAAGDATPPVHWSANTSAAPTLFRGDSSHAVDVVDTSAPNPEITVDPLSDEADFAASGPSSPLSLHLGRV